ncbi:hypothetical protein BO78DRAFT_433543 [Aspergillus sclerotiicarbonarius CBS 121057]|uniref:N-acetyltransferase domain-containing protein n=1 Tax=Aspergillus sclerotiicarbonarius (strain CBS 121057 / IBT 28362) TaxID=1448318 RepID=A0A319EL96_ASPSB|nr:hypothetical protein BO78DRAFT_433543 [Aspergillus sclerotiicarbonarius CBS 121057]
MDTGSSACRRIQKRSKNQKVISSDAKAAAIRVSDPICSAATAATTDFIAPVPDTPLKLKFAPIDDVPELTQVWYNAFSPSMLKVWPDTPDVREWWESANRHDMLHKLREKYLKLIDPNNQGRIAAYAKWSLETTEGRGPRLLKALTIWYLTFLVNLDMLATYTDYRRKGAARLLLE